MTVIELAGGIALGLVFFRLLDTLIDVPFALIKVHNERKKRAEMKAFMNEAMTGLVKHLESEDHKKGHPNARNSSKTSKAKSSQARTSRSKNTGSRTAGSRKAKVSTAKKGV